ncbi:MAG: hypothetical protein Kow00109_27100 [Acidobacteriota bacterium]
MERRRVRRLKYRVKKRPRRWRELLLLLLLAVFLLPIPGTSPILRPLQLDSVEEKIAEWFMNQLASAERPSGGEIPALEGGRYLPVLEPSYAALHQKTRPEQALSALWPWQLRTIDRPFDGRFVDTLQALDSLRLSDEAEARLALFLEETGGGSGAAREWLRFLARPENPRASGSDFLAYWRQQLEDGGGAWNPRRHRPALITTLPFVPAGGAQTGGGGGEGEGGEPSDEGEGGGDEGPKPVRVPEPGSLTLILLGAGFLGLRHRRR